MLHLRHGSHKVYIINDAEYLNEESQNALLKTLEEPPKHTVIILIAENIQSFLPTVASRVKQVVFDRLKTLEIKNYLESLQKEYSYTTEMEGYINGSLKKALLLEQEEKRKEFQEIVELVNYIEEGSKLKALRLMDDISIKNNDKLDYLQYVLYYRKLYRGVTEVERAKNKIKYNGNEDIVKTMLVMKLLT
ncbi:MAG: hypothetical protein PHR25_00315 [Clostridia bacterium]|nr:hypothetical protein [Clostridia bacterium]MDD4375218.1 hypothetical protein [Clostridia bacterium]